MSTELSVNANCKHLTPCGWCELKNKECDVVYPITYPRNYEPYMTSVYAAPSGSPTITYTAERSEDE